MSERSGAAFLLQDVTPVKLVGSLVSGLYPDGSGWVHLAFFQEPGCLVIVREGDRVVLTISRAIAMALISLLYVLLAQINHLRSSSPVADNLATSAHGGSQLKLSVQRHEVVVSWFDVGEGVADVEGQTELRISERFAVELASRLANDVSAYGLASTLV